MFLWGLHCYSKLNVSISELTLQVFLLFRQKHLSLRIVIVQLVDANQRWEVQEAIDWMTALADCKITWIEEPTSPDDILGHQKIAQVSRVTLVTPVY